MRWLILSLVGVWTILTFVGYLYVLPDRAKDEGVLRTYLALASEEPNEHVRNVVESARVALQSEGSDLPSHAEWESLTVQRQSAVLDALREGIQKDSGRPTDQIPILVWSTDDNPARAVQCALFRQWHLRKYGEPVDIRPDPSNRDITKTIVQCIAGAGPDIIEAYGPEQLQQFVDAGVALDVTETAQERGFGVESVFQTAVPSIARDGRQYGFPCNIGYTVLFFHRDLFEEAGVDPPEGAWSFDDLRRKSDALRAHFETEGVRRVSLMNLGAWDIALASGARFFNDDGTACIYNEPQTVAGLKAFQDLMYVDRVMPSPAEAASMSASGGAAMNATAESASASSLFAAKVAVMMVEGRWAYAGLASRNRNRVIIPAIDRALETLPAGDRRRELLEEVRQTIDGPMHHVLRPISDEAFAAMQSILTDDDRDRLINLGVCHVPTLSGTPYYTANARIAMVNRASPNLEYGLRFLEFLASEIYNENINQTFDSICGVPAYCRDEDGIAGPPRPLPGLEAMDSPIFIEAMDYARPDQLSPFIGRARLGVLTGQVLEWVTNNKIGPAEAARLVEERIDRQMRANIARDEKLRELWEQMTGKTFQRDVPLREQIEPQVAALGKAGAP